MTNKTKGWIFGAGLLILMYMLGRKAKNALDTSTDQTALQNPNVKAFLDTIAYSEGTIHIGDNGYNVFLGGSTFDDYSQHPNQKHTAGKYTGTAAGRYQFVYKTWQDLADTLGLTDFTPDSQDLAAVELLRRAGALDDIGAGNFDAAIQKSSGTWASLPYSTAGQPTQKFAILENFYKNSGGSLA